jgi:hypothetical protein
MTGSNLETNRFEVARRFKLSCFSSIVALFRSVLRRERPQLHLQDLGDDPTRRVL